MKKLVLFITFLLTAFIGFSQGGDVLFVHTVTAGNTVGPITYIDHPLLNDNPDAILIITHSLAGDGSVDYNNKPTGIYYTNGSIHKWGIYNEDSSDMAVSNSFNVYIPGTKATAFETISTGGDSFFYIDNALTNNKPDLKLIITHNFGSAGPYFPINLGVWYSNTENKWSIFAQDEATEIPVGAKFNVLAIPSNVGYNFDVSFIHNATAASQTSNNGTAIDHPLLNNNPDAKIMVTHFDDTGITSFNHTLTTYYNSAVNRWKIVTEDTPVDFEGFAFNVVLSLPAPDNDLCENATTLNLGGSFADEAIEGTLLGSDGINFGGVWYKVTVPPTGNLTIETDHAAGSSMNGTWMVVSTGVCGSLIVLGADNNSGNGNFSKIVLSGQTPGEVIHIGIERDINAEPCDTFMISAYDHSLSIADQIIDGFSMYPNPVENILNIKTKNPVKAINIYNMLGQEVLSTSKTQIDMSNLQAGSYVVKVQAGNQIGAYNLIKQ